MFVWYGLGEVSNIWYRYLEAPAALRNYPHKAAALTWVPSPPWMSFKDSRTKFWEAEIYGSLSGGIGK